MVAKVRQVRLVCLLHRFCTITTGWTTSRRTATIPYGYGYGDAARLWRKQRANAADAGGGPTRFDRSEEIADQQF
jgi:hypothetical protein